jgi:Stage III sporulation protein AB (spore_III_AB).
MTAVIMKTSGAFLLFLSSLILSRRYSDRQRERLQNLEALIDLVRHIRTQIDCFMLPADRVIKEYRENDSDIPYIISELKKMRFPDSLQNLRHLLGGEEYEALRVFSHSLGLGYKEEQIKLCTICIDTLSVISEKWKAEMSGKIKMYRAFCLLGSVMAIILFI